MAIVVLDPFAQSYDGSDMQIGAVVDTPVLIGGGSVSDGSDSSYVEMGTWVDGSDLVHIEPLSCDFVLPSGSGRPVAIAFRLRMRSDPDIAANPPLTNPSSVLPRLHAVSDGALLGSSGSGQEELTVFGDILNGNLPEIEERSFWFDDVDLADPTDAGFWFEFAVDAADPAACVTALTGDGLRASIALETSTPLDLVRARRPWLDIYEFQLLVATRGTKAPPCRITGRADNLGSGSGRIWPPPNTHQSSNRRGGGSTY